ncbi:ligand-binding sensor domain-containing protein [Lacibacter sp. H407]|uniref:ligand-binding sensor domain-containing protein n=1 Tax=Lacibacter sp. H407 TaxID=3133423 RepID=UPI0030C19293
MLHKFFLFCGCIFFLSGLSAQQLDYTFTHYSTNSGLLSNQINSIVQDEKGFIWTGTTDGLQRFDGIRYKSFRHIKNDSTSLPSNPVWQLKVDHKKNLWVFLASGEIGIFNTKTFKFRQAHVKTIHPRAEKTSVKRMTEDDKGNIFLILGGNEVLTYNAALHEFAPAHNFFLFKPEWRIADFAPQPGTQKYWISIQDHGFAIYNHATKSLSYAGNNKEDEKLIDEFNGNRHPYGLYFDKQNRLWFFTWGNGFPSIYCYDLRKKEFILYEYNLIATLQTYYEVHGFLEQEDGSLWLRGLQVFGRFNETTKQFQFVKNGYGNERSIAYENIRGLIEDREKNIWVATSNNGVFRFNPAQHAFQNITHINRIIGKQGTGSALSFSETKWGTVLVGTWGDGLYHYDKNFNQIPLNLKGIKENESYSFWNMVASADSNTIWLSAQPGIMKINQDQRTATYYNPPALENRTMRQIAEDKFGNLWVGAQSIGLFKWDAAKGANDFNNGIRKLKNVPQQQVNKIIIDSKGLVWVAFGIGGAYAIDPATEKIVYQFSDQLPYPYKLPEEGVSSLLEYNDSMMIITTSTQIVLYNKRSNKSSLVGTAETISGYITDLRKDKNGYVWLTSTSGLYRINVEKNVFVRFTKEDGIDNENFIVAASALLRDGRMLLGSTNQFIVFDPLAIIVKRSAPSVIVTDFKIRNKSVPVDSLQQLKTINLKPGNNSISIEFSCLEFSTPYKVAYRMSHIDKDWVIADASQQAIYSYLPSGTYLFELRSIDEEGRMGTTITQLEIKMNAPFWKTWWFYGILILLSAAFIYWLDRERMKRKEAMLQMRTSIADNLHNEVNTALNNINILSEMAKIKADKDPQKSKEYIEQIHTKSHNMMIAMDDMLWSIDPHNDNMQKTIERMKEYLDALRNRHQVEIEIVFEKNVELLELNMKLRHEAFLLFKDAINSLVQAGAKKCQIHLGIEKSKLQFTMQIENDCCDMQQLNNLLQRQDMEIRLAAIKAKLDVQVHKSSSVFILQVPVA